MYNDITKGRRVQEVDLWDEVPYYTKASRQGKYAEVISMSDKPQQAVRKLSKTHYEIIRGSRKGEVCEYNLNETKQVEGILKSMKKLKGIIRANFGNGECEKHITLTYRKNMRDSEKFYRDFNVWIKRVKRKYPHHNFEYVAIAEPQERGAWHMHLLIKTNREEWYPDFIPLTKAWREVIGGGGTFVCRDIEAKDVGSYFMAYMTDIVPQDIVDSGDKEAMSKARQKGARIHLYPSGMRFYRCSKGIVRPKYIKTTIEDISKEYPKMIRAKGYEVIAEDEKVIMHLEYRTMKKDK
jgi:disulfide oxidoreductase YuzD